MVGLHTAQLTQPLGRPAGGGGQGGVQPHVVEEGQHPPEGGGLAGARAAGKQHDLGPGRQLHGGALLGGVGDALVTLDPVENAVKVLRRQQLFPAHLGQPLGHKALRLVQVEEVDRLLPRRLLLDDLTPLQQSLQPVPQGVQVLQAQQLGGGGKQLPPGQKGVAVVQVVAQLKEQPGFQPLGVVPLHALVQE